MGKKKKKLCYSVVMRLLQTPQIADKPRVWQIALRRQCTQAEYEACSYFPVYALCTVSESRRKVPEKRANSFTR